MPKSTRLFDAFANNLRELLSLVDFTINDGEFDAMDRLYLCPLSLKVYPHNTLGHEAIDMLTLEHVPPKSTGGKVRCLTAKDINNNATILDVQLSNRLNMVNSIRYGHPLHVKAIVDNSLRFKLQMDLKAVKPLLSFTGNMDNPKSKSLIDKLTTGGSFKVNMLEPSKELSPLTKLAYLKNAYLIAFSEIGYEFIFGLSKIQHPFIDKIRLMIITAETTEDLSFVKEFDYPDKMEGLSIIRIENQKTALSVCYKLPLGNNNNLKIQVLFPNPYDDDFEFRDHIDIGMKFEYFSLNQILLFFNNSPQSFISGYWRIAENFKSNY